MYYLGLIFSMASDLRVQCPRVGARGQNLEHLRIFFFVAFNFLLWIHLLFKQQVLFRVDFLSVTLEFGP